MEATPSGVKHEPHNGHIQNVFAARLPRNPRVQTRSPPSGNDGNIVFARFRQWVARSFVLGDEHPQPTIPPRPDRQRPANRVREPHADMVSRTREPVGEVVARRQIDARSEADVPPRQFETANHFFREARVPKRLLQKPADAAVECL